MIILKLAFRTLMRRKGRMVLIGSLVAFGTFLLAFGGIFASSASKASQLSIIENFTGDLIVYSEKSKELPSPFAFTTPLPNIRNTQEIADVLKGIDGVESWAMYAQNYGIVQVERDGKNIDLPFIFYAIEPASYRKVFSNVKISAGNFFGLDAAYPDGKAATTDTAASSDTVASAGGILISEYQNAQYAKNYGVTLSPGEKVKLLGVTEGGVNTVSSTMLGTFNPVHYTSVFNYINFVDAPTYTTLYNYTGVESLPAAFNAGLANATADESSLFALAGNDTFGKIDLASLKTQALSGFTMIAVKLSDHSKVDSAIAELRKHTELGVKAARWDAASGFYAQISLALQAFIFLATGLIFLVVTMILMNTLIINVVERTAEIGTMRAIGADKSFVREVFLAETIMLNTVSALVGIAITFALLAFGGSGGFPLPETISQFLIGGGFLPLKITATPFAIALVTVVGVSVLATIYPVSVATSITPLKAMSDH